MAKVKHKKCSGLTEVLLMDKKMHHPSKKIVASSVVKNLKKEREYAAENPDAYWDAAAREISWFQPYEKVFEDKEKPFYKWFIGGKTNLCYNALDRHILTPNRDKTAIIAENEIGEVSKLTYLELYKKVNKFANALRKEGVKKGDRVGIYMPNIPQVAIAMLACLKIGAAHSVVYAGFSAQALNKRLKDAKAKVLVTADGTHRRGKKIDLKSTADEAVATVRSIKKVVVVKNTKQKIKWNTKLDVLFDDFIDKMPETAPIEMMDAEDMAFVLYTSGTTGMPKGVVHVHGGYGVGINKTFKTIFNIQGDEVYWCTADPGWITGHSYIIYAPLMAGITTIQYEGVPDFPQPNRIWKMIDKYKVNVLYTAPTLIRAMMKYGDKWPKTAKLESLKLLGSVGEPINPEAWKWYYKVIGKSRCPIMDTWWQTETGMMMIAPIPAMPLKAGSATKPFFAIEAAVVDRKGKKVPVGKGGYLVIKNQWPSMIRTIFNSPERYIETYWKKIPGVYTTGDLAFVDKDGYYWIQGRADDVMNISGHRIGSAEIESALVAHPKVAEAGIIGIPHPVKGEVAKAFLILKHGLKGDEKLAEELKLHARKTIGPMAVIGGIEFVDSLPKTRSGKIMRRVLKAKELGLPLGDISALVD